MLAVSIFYLFPVLHPLFLYSGYYKVKKEKSLYSLLKTDLSDTVRKMLDWDLRALGSSPGFDINWLHETGQLLEFPY